MRYVQSILITLLFLVSNHCLAGHTSKHIPTPIGQPIQSLDQILARVNSDIITQSDFDHAMKSAREQQAMSHAHGMPVIPPAKLKKAVLERLISKRMQLQMAKQQKIVANKKQVDAAISDVAKQHKLTTKALYAAVAQQGLNKQAYREKIRNQITIMILQRAVIGSKVKITDAQIKAYQAGHSAKLYEVGDILIPLAAKPSQRALQVATKKAAQVKSALNKSHDFDHVADEYAPETHSMMSFRGLHDFPDAFVSSIQTLAVNHTAGPIRAPNGLHILYLLGTKKNPKRLSDRQVHNLLFQERSEKIIAPWLKKLRDTSDIEMLGQP